MDLLTNNIEWIFSGIGTSFIVWLCHKFYQNNSKTPKATSVNSKSNSENSNTTNITINGNEQRNKEKGMSANEHVAKKSLDQYKNCTRILFIDDDTRFKVVNILNKCGWVHTKLIKDSNTIDDRDITEADILFIDIQGVGVLMGFSDEGLGLALAIKEKYPEKKVIIYSAESEGDRFHESLNKADSFLAKNADPYQFQKLVEEFTIGLNS